MSEKILSLKNIFKTYPGVIAINDVSIDFNKGEVHALIGENGAGKSTLIKIISGAITPDGGKIIVAGQEHDYMTPNLSRKLGIEVVYQEINLVFALSVAENIFLGNPIRRGIRVDFETLIKKTRELFESMKVNIDPLAIVKDLTVAQMQLVEIAKAISREAKIIIMDEPTATLTNVEIDILFGLIKNLKEKGTTIIYISHRLEELFQISERITVMRDGRKIATLNTKDSNRSELISLMVGRELVEDFPTRNRVFGAIKLEVKNLSGHGIKNISFQVRAGEILGLSGLVGAGRTELVKLIFGAYPSDSGEIFINGKKVNIKSPKDAVKAGLGLLPEDRKLEGVLLNLSIRWNITLPILKKLTKYKIIVDKNKEKEIVHNYKETLDIKTPSMNQLVKNLSGGNQQKIVLSKWMASNSRILIFDEPTRGIDVGAKHEIYKLIHKMAEDGIAIIMISSEMNEVIGLADRMLVLAEGSLVATLNKSEFNQDKILNLAFANQ